MRTRMTDLVQKCSSRRAVYACAQQDGARGHIWYAYISFCFVFLFARCSQVVQFVVVHFYNRLYLVLFTKKYQQNIMHRLIVCLSLKLSTAFFFFANR